MQTSAERQRGSADTAAGPPQCRSRVPTEPGLSSMRSPSTSTQPETVPKPSNPLVTSPRRPRGLPLVEFDNGSRNTCRVVSVKVMS
ncbi:hypothetical protein ACFOJ6_18320 [Gordonia humi]|uniref:hypothetical protein n=1 Tax=Gordonia humi TaxID=686429 RepID=UPI0036138853